MSPNKLHKQEEGYNAAVGEEEVEDNSIHHLRSSRTWTASFTAGALQIHSDLLAEEVAVRSSISGRLGGQILSTLRAAADSEGTPLLRKKQTAPPLKAWIVPALLCAAAYAFYNIFIKKGSADIHPILGGVVLQFVAAILGTVLLGAMVVSGDASPDKIHYDRNGLYWSVCAGLAVGTAEMLSFFVSSLGVQASQFIPIIIGGAVMFGAVLGLLMLKEQMMLYGWSGIFLLVSGIAMVATDNGDKVEEGGTATLSEGPPPLAAWIVPALLCAAAYAFYNIFIKKSSASINPILGGVVLQFVAAIYGSLLLSALILEQGGIDFLNVNLEGFSWACCAGIAVGTAEMLSFCVSGMGVDASKSIPIIIGGSIMMGAILGLVMIGETLFLQGWAGVTILMIGIGLVATDPGEKVQGH